MREACRLHFSEQGNSSGPANSRWRWPRPPYRCRLVTSEFQRHVSDMAVRVYGCNHVAIEVADVKKAAAFYKDVFNLEQLDQGEGDAFFKLGQHQFLAMFESENVQPDRGKHFGIMVR